jgi:hypothetical protein
VLYRTGWHVSSDDMGMDGTGGACGHDERGGRCAARTTRPIIYSYQLHVHVPGYCFASMHADAIRCRCRCTGASSSRFTTRSTN